MLPESLARLRQIVAELRAIPIVDEFSDDRVRQAGQLLREAILLGAFAEHARLRARIGRPQVPELFAPLRRLSTRWWVNDPDIFAWDDAVHELLPDLGGQLNQPNAEHFELWPRAYGAIADIIEAQCVQMKAAPPAPKVDESEGIGGAEPASGQPVVMSPAERKAAWEKLEPAVQNTYWAFQFVATRLERDPKRLEAHEAYEWLTEHGIDQDKGDPGKLRGYKLAPSFESFQRYLSEALKALSENKYTRRAKRPTGGSIVSGSEIEQQRTDDG